MKYGCCFEELKKSDYDYAELTVKHFTPISKVPLADVLHIPTLNLSKEKHYDWLIKVLAKHNGPVVLHYHKGRMEPQSQKAGWIQNLGRLCAGVANLILLENPEGLTEFWKYEDMMEIGRACRGFKNFGFCLDVGHAYLFGGQELIAKYLDSNLVRMFHIHDAFGCKLKKNHYGDHLEIGTGEIDFSFLEGSKVEFGTIEIKTNAESLLKNKIKIETRVG